MFISTKYLVNNYGVDKDIAKFFVDREPPVENLYWHEKLLYLRPAPGYLFIPLIIDLLYKLGLDKDELLSETFISTMEQVGHISALEETSQISRSEAIQKCTAVVKATVVNGVWLNTVIGYFEGENENMIGELAMPFKSLHRGDIFLFSLSMLQFPQTLFHQVAEQWFALIGSLLLLDDAEDIESDKQSGDENAYIESGLNAAGVECIREFVQHSIGKIAYVNLPMAAELDRQHKELVMKPHIHHLLNRTNEFR